MRQLNLKIPARPSSYALFLSVLICLIAFQNCSKPNFEKVIETKDLKSENNGHGYNGKLRYVKNSETGTCRDGQSQELEISVRLGQDPFPDVAFLERENCENIEPRVLQLGEEVILASDLQSLTYKNSILTREVDPPTPQTANLQLYVSPTGSDSNPGTQSQPFLTIQKAADMATPGTTVHVAPGTYAERIVIQNSGTESARIRIASEVKGAAVIRPVSSVQDIVSVEGDYVDLVGFEVDGSGSPAARAGIGLRASHSSVQNNWVHAVGASVPCDNIGLTGIKAYGSAFSKIDEHLIANKVHDVGIRGCRWHNTISHYGTGSVVNNVVSNSNIGIVTWHDVHHLLIANNTVFNTEYGIYVGSGDYLQAPAPADYIKVLNNIVVYATQVGIMELASTVGSHNEFFNNLAWSNAKDWELAPGRVNNNPISADPLFVNYQANASGDYRLQKDSPAVDRGISVSAPVKDIDGYRRDSVPDLGAFEWHP